MNFNREAWREREENKRHITAYRGKQHEDGSYTKVLEVDREYVTYNGEPIKTLGAYHRHKFENLLIISEMPQQIHVVYR